MQLDSYSVLLWGRPLSVVILPPFSFHFSRPLVYVLEDAVHGLCSCSSFSGSCFRPFRRYVSFRSFCVGGQSIHVTFSTRAADMYTDMPIVDRGATATSGIRAQNQQLFRSGIDSEVIAALDIRGQLHEHLCSILASSMFLLFFW